MEKQKPVAFTRCDNGRDALEDVTPTMRCGSNHSAHLAAAIPINGMTLNKELRDKQMTGVGQEGDPMFSVRADGAQHAVGFYSNQGSLGQGNNENLSPTLKAAASTNHAAVAIPISTQNALGRGGGREDWPLGIHKDGDPAPTLSKSHCHAVRLHMAVRRLTPKECERLQGFTTRIRRAMITVCLDQQKRTARVAVKCLRLPSSALIAEESESLETALYADQGSQSDPANQENVVVAHVLQLHETRLLRILSAGKLMWSASGAVPLSEFLPHTHQDDIAQLLVQLQQGAEALVHAGRAESQAQETHFTLPASGSWFVRWFGPEKKENASDADALKTEDITSTTLNLSPQKLSSEQTRATWLCSALNVIGLCIPKTTTAKSFVSFVLDVESDHTLIPWRGKPPKVCPDGPRYKALGNSMAVPCMRWIGERISNIEKKNVRYLSVCSGIEAASVAWEPIGWTPVAFAEVEKFPSAVLAHHWPDVPNLGDMTKYEQWKDLPAIDLLVGGTPCQSFSVAGLRKGLRDPRGGLMLTFLEIAQRRRPRWIVWENVPGVLSSNGGRDFGSFLGALGSLGYGWAYRILDAQWCGVAQRRRRVFVVANLGDGAAPAKVLFESESVRRNPAPSRETGERTAADAAGGVGNGRRGGADVTGAIDCRIGAQRAQNAQAGHYVADTSGTIDAHYYKGCGSAAFAEREVVACLTDGAHQGGGLMAKMPTRAAYLPALANPLTARMGKGINTTLDEGQTAIVCGKEPTK